MRKTKKWFAYLLAATMAVTMTGCGGQVDLIYTAPWCYYNEEAAKGAFLMCR